MRVHTKPEAALVAAGRTATKDLAARAYDGIREAILNASFEPGQPLQESYLADWLGIGRTPVREAIKRLQSEGLVESLPSRGVVVAQVPRYRSPTSTMPIWCWRCSKACPAASRPSA